MEPLAAMQSPVGILNAQVPLWASDPPIEAVVFAWGASEDHQLGLDTMDPVWTPKVVESLLGVRFRGRAFRRTPFIAGSRNTLAIDAEGQLWSWGWNARGTLGHGHRSAERKPRMVAGLKGVKVVQAALGGWHCLALDDAGQVYCWGGNEYAQCDEQVPARDLLVPQPCMPQLRVTQVACGGMSSMVLTSEGNVWTWGESWGDFALDVSRTPRQVQGAHNIAAIAAGGFHNMALNRAGEVFTWGTNDYGQLGNGSTSYSTTPSKVVDLEEVPISDIAAGGWHSVALSADGSIIVWGRGEYGRLGIRDRTGSSKLRPFKVLGMEGHVVVQVSAGGTHTLALTAEGRMFIWGRASYGRLGLGEGARDVYEPEECVLPGGHDRWKIAAITCGGRHSMALAVPMRDAASSGGAALASAASLAAANGNGDAGSSLSVATAAGLGGAGAGVGEEGATSGLARSPGRLGSSGLRHTSSFGSNREQQGAASAATGSGPSRTNSSVPWPSSRLATAVGGPASSFGGVAPEAGAAGAAAAAIAAAPLRANSGRMSSSPGSRPASAGSSLAAINQGLGRTGSSMSAMAAAAAASGRVSAGARSPVPGSAAAGLDSGGSARAWEGEAAARHLGAGEQAPMSPRAFPPPMSPSQSRARRGGGLSGSFADFPSFSGGFGSGGEDGGDEDDEGGSAPPEDEDEELGASSDDEVPGGDEAAREEEVGFEPGSMGQLVGSAAWQEGGVGTLLLRQAQQVQAQEVLMRSGTGLSPRGSRPPSRGTLAQSASFGSFTEYNQLAAAAAAAGSSPTGSGGAAGAAAGASPPASSSPLAGSRWPSTGGAPPSPSSLGPSATAAVGGGPGSQPRGVGDREPLPPSATSAAAMLSAVPAGLPPLATGAAPVPAVAGDVDGAAGNSTSGAGPAAGRALLPPSAELLRVGSGGSGYSSNAGSGSGARPCSGLLRVGSPSVFGPQEAAAALEAHQRQQRQLQEQQATILAQEGLHPRVTQLLRSESTHESLSKAEEDVGLSGAQSPAGSSSAGGSSPVGAGTYDVGLTDADPRPGRTSSHLHSHLS